MDFSNKNINMLMLHSIVWRFADNVLNVFGAVYLLKIGISFPVVALVMAGAIVVRTLLRPFSMILSEKIGLRKALIFGVVVSSGLFLALGNVHGLNFWLCFYGFYMALQDITYWLPYHSYYAVVGDEEKRGKQVGFQLGTIMVFQTVAPLLGGITIIHFGFWPLYLSATLITLLSAIPLFFTKDRSPGISLNWKEALKVVDKRGMFLGIGDGILNIHSFVWNIVLFYLVGNYAIYGGLTTFELLSTSILAIVLGYFLDKGKGEKISIIGLIIIGIVVISRVFWVHTILQVIITDVVVAFAYVFYKSSFSVGFYNMAKESKNTLWFHFFGEIGWDIGAAASFLMSALLFSLGVPLRFIILLSLPGLLIIHYVLKRFFIAK